MTWTPTLMADEYLRGVAISPDGQRIYVTGAPRAVGAMNQPALHVSKDGGKGWSSVHFNYQLAGFTPSHIVALAVDPNDVDTLYARAEEDPTSSLIRISSDGATVTEVVRADGATNQLGIGGVAFDPAAKTLYIGAKSGLYRSVDRGPAQKISNLDQAQCVSLHGGKTYACSWNYPPDNAAIARSDDGGASFKKVFQYAETVAPIDTCPASSPVGMICPAVWTGYCAMLGIDQCASGPGPARDAGPDAATPAPSTHGCSCALDPEAKAKAKGTSEAWTTLGMVAVAAGMLRVRVRRRRASGR